MVPSDTAERPLAEALEAARDAAVVCDLSPLAVLAISGADADTFLQGQLSCDVETLPPAEARYASFNSPKGRMLANLVLWRERAPASARWSRATSPSRRAKRLAMYVLRSKVTLEDVSAATPRFGLGGPRAADVLRDAWGVRAAPMTVVRTDRGAVVALPGPRYVLLADAAGARADPARSRPRALRRLAMAHVRAGVPVVTAPLSDQLIAQAANLDLLGGLDFRKGCYTGQEIIARTQHLGRLKERLRAFHVAGDPPLAGARVFGPPFGDQPCGIVVNAAPAPGGGSDLLAVVQLAATDAGRVAPGHAGRSSAHGAAAAVRDSGAPGPARPSRRPELKTRDVPRAARAGRASAIRRRHRRQSRRASRATRGACGAGGTKASSPAAISKPAARGSVSPARVAGRSSPMSASPIDAIPARRRAARSSRARSSRQRLRSRASARSSAMRRPTTASTSWSAIRRRRRGARTGRRPRGH